MFKYVLSASLIAASLALPSFAATETSAKPSTKPMARHEGRSPERFVQKLEKDLKLTPEQTAKVREILAKDAPPADVKDKGQHPRHECAALFRSDLNSPRKCAPRTSTPPPSIANGRPAPPSALSTRMKASRAS